MNRSHWSEALFQYIEYPEKFKDVVVHFDEQLVCIKDAYPKAKFHFLILPRIKIPSIYELKESDIPLIKKLNEIASTNILEKIDVEKSQVEFKYGFHAIPTMKQVHLHMISTDFQSPCLKHKKHWNSFTTEFFVTVDELITKLKDKGRFEIDKKHCEELLKTPLKCHLCGAIRPNMPALKRHIEDCYCDPNRK